MTLEEMQRVADKWNVSEIEVAEAILGAAKPALAEGCVKYWKMGQGVDRISICEIIGLDSSQDMCDVLHFVVNTDEEREMLRGYIYGLVEQGTNFNAQKGTRSPDGAEIYTLFVYR